VVWLVVLRSPVGPGLGARKRHQGHSLRAVIGVRGDRLLLMRRRRGRGGRLRRRFRRFERGALLLDPDFLFERISKLVGRFLEFREALAERLADLGQLPRTEDDQGDDEDDDQLVEAEGTKHGLLLEPRKAGRGRSTSLWNGAGAGSRRSGRPRCPEVIARKEVIC